VVVGSKYINFLFIQSALLFQLELPIPTEQKEILALQKVPLYFGQAQL